MNDQLQGAMASLIAGLIEFSEQASSAVVSTVPVIVEQLLLYHITVNWAGGFLLILLICLWARVARKIVNAIPKPGESCKYYQWVRYGESHELKDWAGCVLYGGAVICSFLLIPLPLIIGNLLKLHLAPYVWLIEYARGLL